MRFCTHPPDPELGTGFTAEEFREAVEDAADTWNNVLHGAAHERALSGPAIDYVGDCEDGEFRSPRNEIAVRRVRSSGVTVRSASGGGQHCFTDRDGQWECRFAW